MHRYYLTYQFALGFERLCLQQLQAREAARSMALAFGDFVEARDPSRELELLASAQTSLDCARRALDESQGWSSELRTKHLVLKTRFAALIRERAQSSGSLQLELMNRNWG